jgi:hypothetical protein
MSHHISSQGGGSSRERGDLICPDQGSLTKPDTTALAADLPSVRSSGKKAMTLGDVGVLLVLACPFLLTGYLVVDALGHPANLLPVDLRPGIGNPEKAKAKIEIGMSKDEVRSLLGRPHQTSEDGRGDDWAYHCGGGVILLVYFGPDDRVTSRRLAEPW